MMQPPIVPAVESTIDTSNFPDVEVRTWLVGFFLVYVVCLYVWFVVCPGVFFL